MVDHENLIAWAHGAIDARRERVTALQAAINAVRAEQQPYVDNEQRELAVAAKHDARDVVHEAMKDGGDVADARLAQQAAIADARQRAGVYREAAAKFEPRLNELRVQLHAAAMQLSQIETQLPLIALRQAGEDVEAALANVEPRIQTWLEKYAAYERAYHTAFGEPPRLDPADLLLARTLTIWVRQIRGRQAVLNAIAHSHYPIDSGGLSRGVPEPRIPD